MKQFEEMHNELDRLFDLFNGHYYAGKIKKPVITIQTNGKDRGVMGWCTLDKIWKDHAANEYYYEITICSEYLYRDIREICSTLLHEMAHLYNVQYDIKDTSRGRTYHNKRFKQTAEDHGLIIEYSERIGWSSSALNDEARAFVEENANKEVFVLTRARHAAPKPPQPPTGGEEGTAGTDGGEEAAKPKQSTRRYICPSCGCIIRATKEVRVICGDCNVPFEEAVKEV